MMFKWYVGAGEKGGGGGLTSYLPVRYPIADAA